MTKPSPPSDLRPGLLAWFDREKRDLPWRRTADPYAIWVSEVMLQQTQVATVIPYWTRFLARFPTVTSLAEAGEPDVLALWRGLGYYSRARNLHRAARQVASEHGGQLPGEVEALAKLPGFGRYTAGAVASIAFGREAPLVDGNVARVLTRLFAVEGAPGDPARERRLWELAGELVRGPRPGDFNQALMELGATVCRKEAPSCLLCPVREGCAAHRLGRVADLPPARVRAPRKSLSLACAVLTRAGRVLLARRESRGLFGGLWELPSVECAGTPGPSEVARAFRGILGGEPTPRAFLGEVRRALTHRDLTLHLWSVARPGSLGPRPPYVALAWTKPSEAQGLGISRAMEQALELALSRSLPGAP